MQYFFNKKLYLFFIGFFFYTLSIVSQTKVIDTTNSIASNIDASISGQIIDETNEVPVEYAIIKLFKTKDSKSTQNAITNSQGKFNLSVNKTGIYDITINLIGYESKTMLNIKIDDENKTVNLGELKLNPTTINLDEVTIEGNYKLKIDVDKKIYRIDKNALTANGTAGDILQNIPSVFVSQDGKVKLRGGKVKIYIDGKPSSIFGISRSQVLDYIPASLIESIEVINDPSAKYDADGGSGIINIVLKNQKKPGINAMLILGAGTTDRYNGSLNFSYNYKKFNFFASYDAKSTNVESNETKNRESDLVNTVKFVNQERNLFSKTTNQNIRIRTEYSFNKKSVLSFSFLNSDLSDKDLTTIRYRHFDNLQQLTNIYDRKISDADKDKSQNISLNYTKKFKKSAQELTVDLFYSKGDENTNGKIYQQYYNLDLTPSNTPPISINTYNMSKEKNIVGQIDYSQPLQKKAKLEFGIKSRFKSTNIDYQLDNYYIPLDIYITDQAISDQFNYNLNINSGYITYRKKIKTFSYKFGVRVEQSNIDFTTGQNIAKTKQNFTDFFPSAYFLNELKGNNKLSFHYSRRVDRPAFREINPLQQYNDPLFLNKGNPNLKPEYTNSFDITHIKSWKQNSISGSLYYRQSEGTIQRVIVLDPAGVTITNYQNVKTSKTYGTELTGNFQVYKWWKLNTSLNFYQNTIDGTNISDDFKSDKFSYSGKINTNLNFWENSVFQISGNYQSAVFAPYIKNHEQYFVDTSLKQYFLNKKLSISLRCSDVFNTQRKIYDLNGPNYKVYSDLKKQSRIFFIGITYRLFGNNKKNEPQENEDDSDSKDDSN